MASIAEHIVETGSLPDGLIPAAQGVANQLVETIAIHDWVESLPEDDQRRIETVRPNVIHSYVYEKLDDGSVLAIYATEDDVAADGIPLVRLKAFPSRELAGMWTPRDEYAGWRHTSPVTIPGGDSDYTIGSGQ